MQIAGSNERRILVSSLEREITYAIERCDQSVNGGRTGKHPQLRGDQLVEIQHGSLEITCTKLHDRLHRYDMA